MTHSVLVPMDDSEAARAALAHALAVHSDAEITVLHAVDELEAGYGGGPAGRADEIGPAFFGDVRAIADEYGRTVETTVVEGTSADAILEYADDREVDQIVMGSEGRAGVSRMLLGSVAEAVARRASIPVTIVPS